MISPLIIMICWPTITWLEVFLSKSNNFQPNLLDSWM